jgi:hypothetical protein
MKEASLTSLIVIPARTIFLVEYECLCSPYVLLKIAVERSWLGKAETRLAVLGNVVC